MNFADIATFYIVIAVFVYLAMTSFVLTHRAAFEKEWKRVPLFIFLTALVWFIFIPYLVFHRNKRS